jgi:hypothetical protein
MTQAECPLGCGLTMEFGDLENHKRIDCPFWDLHCSLKDDHSVCVQLMFSTKLICLHREKIVALCALDMIFHVINRIVNSEKLTVHVMVVCGKGITSDRHDNIDACCLCLV